MKIVRAVSLLVSTLKTLIRLERQKQFLVVYFWELA